MDYRIERDSMGEIKVPSDKYWGAQTQRSLENFRIGTEKMPAEIICAFGIIKLAAVRVNAALRPQKMTEEKKSAIEAAAKEVILGKLFENFPLAHMRT